MPLRQYPASKQQRDKFSGKHLSCGIRNGSSDTLIVVHGDAASQADFHMGKPRYLGQKEVMVPSSQGLRLKIQEAQNHVPKVTVQEAVLDISWISNCGKSYRT